VIKFIGLDEWRVLQRTGLTELQLFRGNCIASVVVHEPGTQCCLAVKPNLLAQR